MSAPPAPGSVETLALLRYNMAAAGVDAIIVPTDDAHASEYVAPCDQRRAYVSGFTGSAGTAVVTKTEARVWTDARYFLQASQQLKGEWQLMKDRLPETPSVSEWLVSNLPAGSAIGIDAQCTSLAFQAALASRVAAAAAEKQLRVVLLPHSLVDSVWASAQPAAPAASVFVHAEQYAGASHVAKLAQVRAELKKRGLGAWVFRALDQIAWLFNLRGSDIEFNPVFWSYALVFADGPARLYVAEAKLDDAVRAHLAQAGVEVAPYERIFADLAALTVPTWLDAGASAALGAAVPAALLEPLTASPLEQWKSIKNPVEVAGMRAAHVRDAAALSSWLCWLEAQLHAGTPGLDEYTVGEKLAEFRAAQPDFVSLSFESIVGSGPNGAIIHYKAEKETAAPVTLDRLLLVDSGGQYRDGTTDVTRTVHFGTPSAAERRAFTRVLQGHIALDRAVFPSGTNGFQLDTLARMPLWNDGLDYAHGTGHGVGAFLNVHEGPQSISMRATSNVPLAVGMMTSNEPGYYKEGEFGVRIESVVACREHSVSPAGRQFLCFENLTVVPLQTKLMDTSLMSDVEIRWVNAHNARCLELVGPLVGATERAWLEKECKPLA